MSFTEKSGTVDAHTPKYTWTQTREEVSVIVPLPAGTKGRDIECKISTNHLLLRLKNRETSIIDGDLCGLVKVDDSTWTIEDGNVDILLCKAKQHESWSSLIQGEYELDAVTKEKMDKKMLLEKFQEENPGFDFSGAEFSGNLPENPATFLDDLKE